MARPTTRERYLAGDERAGAVARRSVRERHRATVRRSGRPLLLVALGTMAGFAVAAVFADGPLQRGLVIGSGLTFTGCAMAALVVLGSGTAPLMTGGLAEMWTAAELRPLREHGWHLVNHVRLQAYGDLDHVLVGPGGIVVVETKWRSEARDVVPDSRWFGPVLACAAEDARRVGLWHEVARHGSPPVQPVVAVWGPAARDLPVRRHSGVVVLPGDELQQCVLRRGRAGLDDAQVDAVLTALDAQVARRDAADGAVPLPSTTLLLQALATGSVASLLLLLGIGWAMQATDSLLVGLGLLLLAGTASQLVVRRTRWRWHAQATQLLSAGLLVLVAGRVVTSLL